MDEFYKYALGTTRKIKSKPEKLPDMKDVNDRSMFQLSVMIATNNLDSNPVTMISWVKCTSRNFNQTQVSTKASTSQLKIDFKVQ